jgi:hypothetical protein
MANCHEKAMGGHTSELEILGMSFPESERRAFEFLNLQKAATLIQTEDEKGLRN